MNAEQMNTSYATTYYRNQNSRVDDYRNKTTDSFFKMSHLGDSIDKTKPNTTTDDMENDSVEVPYTPEK